jgi:hypothetical protein
VAPGLVRGGGRREQHKAPEDNARQQHDGCEDALHRCDRMPRRGMAASPICKAGRPYL